MDIKRVASVVPSRDLYLHVVFDDGREVEYDVGEDVEVIPAFLPLRTIVGLFVQVRLAASRTCVYWNDDIDFPGDIIYEYGTPIEGEGMRAGHL